MTISLQCLLLETAVGKVQNAMVKNELWAPGADLALSLI